VEEPVKCAENTYHRDAETQRGFGIRDVNLGFAPLLAFMSPEDS
jgi:hypothetical protein